MDKKAEAILQAPKLENINELQSYLGFINYLSKFLPSLIQKLTPIYTFLWKNSEWNWNVIHPYHLLR